MDQLEHRDATTGNLKQEFERFRERLLSLTRRNRLLNYRKSKTRTVQVVDELPDSIFQHLVIAGKAFSFDPLLEDESADDAARWDAQLPRPSDDGSIDPRHRDSRLQTDLSEVRLERVLKNLIRDAKTGLEETGINYLHLAIGFLDWCEAQASDIRSLAPLILIPVALTREYSSRRGRYEYRLNWTEEEIKENLSLRRKVEVDFGLKIPPYDGETLPEEYFAEVHQAVARHTDWTVSRESLLGLFSFHKLEMYEDLDVDNWAEIESAIGEGSLAAQLINGGNEEGSGVSAGIFAPDYQIDDNPQAQSILLPMEADSSQHSALIDIAQGKSLVIEGPPGTGKSQTITNAIAWAIRSSKRVLFVAEKLAALEVVHNKLQRLGLDAFCLELHSDVATPRRVFESLKKRLEARFPQPRKIDELRNEIAAKQAVLDRYLEATRQRLGPYDEPLYELFWRVVELRSRGHEPIRGIECGLDVDRAKFHDASASLEELVRTLREFPDPVSNPWWGMWPKNQLQLDAARIGEILGELKAQGEKLNAAIEEAGQGMPGDRAYWHRVFLEIDASKWSELAVESEWFPDEWARRLIDPQVHEMACQLSEQVARASALQARLEPVLMTSLAEAAPHVASSLSVLKSPLEHALASESLSSLNALHQWAVTSIEAVDQLMEGGTALTAAGFGATRNLYEFQKATRLYQFCCHSAVRSPEALTPELFLNHTVSVFRSAKKRAQQLEARREELQQIFHWPSLPDQDAVLQMASQIRPHVNSWLRFINSGYRKAMRKLKSFKQPGHLSPVEALRYLDLLWQYREDEAEFCADSECRNSLGDFFAGLDTNWERLEERLAWGRHARKDFGLGFDQARTLTERCRQQEVSCSAAQLKSYFQQVSTQLVDARWSHLGIFDDRVNMAPLSNVRRDLEDHAKWIERFQQLISVLQTTDEMTVRELCQTVEQIVEWSSLKQAIESQQAFAAEMPWFQGVQTDVARLQKAVQWVATLRSLPLPEGLHRAIVEGDLEERCQRLSRASATYRTAMSQWDTVLKKFDTLSTRDARWLNWAHSMEEPRDLVGVIEGLERRLDELPAWTAFARVLERCSRAGVVAFAQHAISCPEASESIVETYQVTLFSRLIDQALAESPVLAQFSRPQLDNAREKYRELDAELMRLNRRQIAADAADVHVPVGNNRGRVHEKTELSLIRHEIAKRARHCRIRDMLRRAGNATQALKPCFMMSPLAVSQYLEPGAVQFDLVIMDEASQIKPEDALGTILRSNQLVVVGDPKQLPPTSFFDRVGEEVDEEIETQFDNSESILEVAMKTFPRVRRLRWHYRSQHHSLIEFSNEHFYDGDLVVFPSPTDEAGRLGVHLRRVEQGTFQAGENVGEAEAVVQAIIDHVLTRPEETLGVGAFNIRQAQLIEALLDDACQHDTQVRRAIEKFQSGPERLFIKNLENLQGDERDVIFISYTYGPDPASGRVMQRFGPINSEHGWRRLNVLITRARKRVEVFTSMTPAQIIGGPDRPRGVNALRDYLTFAQRGLVPDPGSESGRAPDSPFEIAVARVVRKMGLEAVPQVGVAGYFIDIGVRRPDGNRDFILGIECDGASYHSSKSARDRDRLRQEVIESRGWRLHRIWSTDWFLNQAHEERRLQRALESAIAGSGDLSPSPADDHDDTAHQEES